MWQLCTINLKDYTMSLSGFLPYVAKPIDTQGTDVDVPFALRLAIGQS